MRGRAPDDATLASVWPSRGPVAMLGTPKEDADREALLEAVVENEEDEAVLADGSVLFMPPPPTGAPALPQSVRPEGWAAWEVPFPAPGTVESVIGVDEVSDEAGSSEEGEGETNGAALTVEEIDGFLADGRAGRKFSERHVRKAGDGGVEIVEEERFLGAVGKAKRELRMLVVVVLDMEDEEGEGRRVWELMESEMLAGVLNNRFLTAAVDMSPAKATAEKLLGRLGMHALPAVLLLSDIGCGVGIVDMFAPGFYGGEGAASRVSARLLETAEVFEFGYEAARARRVASFDREELIAEQDEAFAAVASADRARDDARDAKRAAEERAGEEKEAATQRLPVEPENGGARLAVRLPDGSRVDRRFDEERTRVRDLFDWCVSLGVRNGSFALSIAFPRKRLVLEEHGSCSLEAAGLSTGVALLVDAI